MVRTSVPDVVCATTSMTKRPLARSSALGPAPGSGSALSSSARVGPKDIPATSPSSPAVIPVAMTGALSERPKSVTSW